MARSQIEEQLIDTVKELESNLKSAYSDLNKRLKALEEQSDSQEPSPDSSDAELSPDRRRSIMDKMYSTQFQQKDSQGHYKINKEDQPLMPLCKWCRHSTQLYDGEIMQYQSGEIEPRYTYSGFVVCSKIGHFPLRSGPKLTCTMMDPDEGEKPDLTTRPLPRPF